MPSWLVRYRRNAGSTREMYTVVDAPTPAKARSVLLDRRPAAVVLGVTPSTPESPEVPSHVSDSESEESL